MPEVASTVGALPVPAPVGAQDAPIVDTTVSGLLSYLAFWTQYALNPVLAQMTAPPVSDACPAANRYPISTTKRVMKFNLPALFVWWDGKSITKPFTTIKDVRQRDIHAMYIFPRVASDQINGVDAQVRYAGLISTVDASWNRAISRRAHPGYSAPGFKAGTPIGVILGLNDINYLGGLESDLPLLVQKSAREAAVQTGPQKLGKESTVGIAQAHPCLHGVFRVLEEVGVDQFVDGDTMGDVLYEPSLNGVPGDDRWLRGAEAIGADTGDDAA